MTTYWIRIKDYGSCIGWCIEYIFYSLKVKIMGRPCLSFPGVPCCPAYCCPCNARFPSPGLAQVLFSSVYIFHVFMTNQQCVLFRYVWALKENRSIQYILLFSVPFPPSRQQYALIHALEHLFFLNSFFYSHYTTIR